MMRTKALCALGILLAMSGTALAAPQSVWGLKVGDGKKGVADNPVFKCTPSMKERLPFENSSDVEAVVCEWYKDQRTKPESYAGKRAPETLTVKFYKPFNTIGEIRATARSGAFDELVAVVGGSPDVTWTVHGRTTEAHWIAGDLITTVSCRSPLGCSATSGRNARRAKELSAAIQAHKKALNASDGKAKGMMDAFNAK